jgi:Fe-S-cluster containining protein
MSGDCLSWLSVCAAECCKQLFFSFRLPAEFSEGSDLFVQGDFSADTKRYLKLHGFVERGRNVFCVRADRVEVVGDGFILFKRCLWLQDDLRCSGHPKLKPIICRVLGDKRMRGIFLTPKCRFRKGWGLV